VHQPGQRQRHTQARGQRAQAFPAIDLDVLAGAERVEAGDPEQDRERQDHGRRLETAADREPCAERRECTRACPEGCVRGS